MSLSPSFASYIITYQRICFLFLKLTISSIDSVIVYYKFIANILKDEGCVTERVMRPMSSLKSIVQPNVLNLFQCFQYAVFLFSRSGAGQQCCYKGDSLMVDHLELAHLMLYRLIKIFGATLDKTFYPGLLAVFFLAIAKNIIKDDHQTTAKIMCLRGLVSK